AGAAGGSGECAERTQRLERGQRQARADSAEKISPAETGAAFGGEITIQHGVGFHNAHWFCATRLVSLRGERTRPACARPRRGVETARAIARQNGGGGAPNAVAEGVHRRTRGRVRSPSVPRLIAHWFCATRLVSLRGTDGSSVFDAVAVAFIR